MNQPSSALEPVSRLYNIVDIAATALFAIEGAAAAAHAGLDILGVIVVGFIVALAGGILRDTLLGDLPPAALRTPSRIVVALVAAATVCLIGGLFTAIPPLPILIADAVGLALFAVTGALKAHQHRANLWVVTILAGVTATGGGVIRDLLLNRTPVVLSESVYGTAALAAGLVTGLLLRRQGDPRVALWIGFTVAVVIRLAAILWNLNLPRVV